MTNILTNVLFGKKQKEAEQLKRQMLSDKGDEIAMLKNTNSKLKKVLESVSKRAELNLDDIRKVLND